MPILMLFYVMLHIMFAYLILFAALFNDVCMLLYFLLLTCKHFFFMLFVFELLTHCLSS